jgi:hypothetical protein
MGNATSITKKIIVKDIDSLSNNEKQYIKDLILNEIKNKIENSSDDANGNKIIEYYGYYIENDNIELKYMYFDVPSTEDCTLYVLLSHVLIDFLKIILEEQNYLYTILRQEIKHNNNTNYNKGYITIKLKK